VPRSPTSWSLPVLPAPELVPLTVTISREQIVRHVPRPRSGALEVRSPPLLPPMKQRVERAAGRRPLRRRIALEVSVEQQMNSYRIRPARLGEAGRLREIEDEAGTRFAGLRLIDEELDVSFPLDDLARLVSMGQVLVAATDGGPPVGMVIASVRDGAVYVEEMDAGDPPEEGAARPARRGAGVHAP